MAKLNKEKVLSSLDEIEVSEQVEFLEKVKQKVVQNLEKSRELAEEKVRDFESTINRINGSY